MKESARRIFLKNIGIAGLGFSIAKPLMKTNSKDSKSLTACETTTLDYYGEGPFYSDNPPLLENNKLAAENDAGTKLTISGRVFNLDCSEFIPDTIIDIWQANDAGAYDNQGFNLRGFVKTNEQGYYLFETILPGKYLNGNKYRPSHIHYKITPPGKPTLVTQLYFEGDESIPADAAASITTGEFKAVDRIIPLTENTDGSLEGTFDIVINGSGIAVGLQELHLNNGMIYELSPNPFTDELKIFYGVFKKAKVGIFVHDVQGKLIAELEQKVHSPEKYTVYWRPDSNVSAGHYFIALKVNDLQVHYLKVVKK